MKTTVVGNGVTWERFEPKTKNPKNQNLEILDFEFCPRLKFVVGRLHFPPL